MTPPTPPGCAWIPLTRGKLTLVDEDQLPHLSRFQWHAVNRARPGDAPMWYARTGTRGMHQIVAGARPGEVVDHRNGDSLDNRRQNLRRCPQSKNCLNVRGRSGTSEFKGVSKRPNGGWGAKIRRQWLGTFPSELEAAVAYDRAALKQFGRWARTNILEARS